MGDDAPCADAAFLVPLKRSPEFRRVRPRLAGSAPHPVVDSWQDDGFHFFVFAVAGAAARQGETPVAVFAMHPESEGPVSAVTVTPTVTGMHAQITNLREPFDTYTAPLPSPEVVTVVVGNGDGHADHRRD